MTEAVFIFLGVGFLLSAILIILLVIMASDNGNPVVRRRKVREDIKKIRSQVIDEE